MESLQMKPQLNKLLWEEKTFGIKAAKLNLEDEVKKEQWNTLIKEFKEYEMIVISNCGNNSKNNLLIGQLNNCFVADINVQFEKKPSNIIEERTDKIKITNNKDVDENLMKIAEQSFIYSRFMNDSNLDEEKAKKIYVDWTRNSFNKYNKYFVTYEECNKSVGFIIFSISENIATIELIAVDREYQNKRIGKAIMLKLEKFLYEVKKEVTLIRVGTQAENKNAIRFYQNSGFKLVEINTIYHNWNRKLKLGEGNF